MINCIEYSFKEILVKKTLDNFLWIGFNCLKATVQIPYEERVGGSGTNLVNSEGRKADSTMKPASAFELGTTGLEI